MLSFALQYQRAIMTMTGNVDNGLRKFELTQIKWVLVEQLTEILKVSCTPPLSFYCLLIVQQVFKHTTQFFSWSTSNLATVIPVMDHIDKLLITRTFDTEKACLPAVCAACGMAKEILNCYTQRPIHLKCTKLQWVCTDIFYGHAL